MSIEVSSLRGTRGEKGSIVGIQWDKTSYAEVKVAGKTACVSEDVLHTARPVEEDMDTGGLLEFYLDLNAFHLAERAALFAVSDGMFEETRDALMKFARCEALLILVQGDVELVREVYFGTAFPVDRDIVPIKEFFGIEHESSKYSRFGSLYSVGSTMLCVRESAAPDGFLYADFPLRHLGPETVTDNIALSVAAEDLIELDSALSEAPLTRESFSRWCAEQGLDKEQVSESIRVYRDLLSLRSSARRAIRERR